MTSEKGRDWLDYLKFAMEALGLAALIVYTGYTVRMYHANKLAADAAKTAAEAAQEQARLSRKQMEGVSAADVEIARNGDIEVFFHTPRSGEVRMNLINGGHVIARDTHLSVALSIQGSGPGSQRRRIFTKDEAIPALRPSSGVNRPDFIYPFQVSPSEYKEILNADACLIVDGSFDYENGFDKRVGPQKFCLAYVWGPAQFGRWVGACADAAMKMHEAKGVSLN